MEPTVAEDFIIRGGSSGFETPQARVRVRNRWRKTSVPRGHVLVLRRLFKDSWKEIIAEENRANANKRKPWPDDRRAGAIKQGKQMTQMSPKEKASVREVIEKGYELKVERDKEAKKQKKVDALVSLVGKAK